MLIDLFYASDRQNYVERTVSDRLHVQPQAHIIFYLFMVYPNFGVIRRHYCLRAESPMSA